MAETIASTENTGFRPSVTLQKFLKNAMTHSPPSTESEDALYQAAKALVLNQRKASVALVQRHLRLGYKTTCRLFERMQAEGVVVPLEGEDRRWVLSEGALQRAD